MLEVAGRDHRGVLPALRRVQGRHVEIYLERISRSGTSETSKQKHKAFPASITEIIMHSSSYLFLLVRVAPHRVTPNVRHVIDARGLVRRELGRMVVSRQSHRRRLLEIQIKMRWMDM